MYNNYIEGHQDKQKTNKLKNLQKQETQQSDRNMIKHDKKGLDKPIAAKQTFYQ